MTSQVPVVKGLSTTDARIACDIFNGSECAGMPQSCGEGQNYSGRALVKSDRSGRC